MKEKMKKQKKKLLIKISLVLICAWLIVSTAFCGVVIDINKKELTDDAISKGAQLINNLTNSEFSSSLYHFGVHKEKSYYDLPGDDIPRKSEHNVLDMYNTNVHITLGTIWEEYDELANTDKDIIVQFEAVDSNIGKLYFEPGLLNFDDLKSLLGTKSYETIKEYLLKGIDKDGNYYELLCTEFYYDQEEIRIIPKKVELVLSNPAKTWYAEDEVIFAYELEPKGVEGLDLHKSGIDQRNLIPDQFVLNEFASDGLISNPCEEFKNEDTSRLIHGYGHEAIENSGLFKYLVTKTEIAPVYQGKSDEILSNTEMREYQKTNLLICYAQRIDVLEHCYPTLIAGASVILLFFLVIGIILTVMLWKVLKTQIEEEQKRTEITNALAHDIKTPLFIIEGYAQNLKENLYTEKREHYADRIMERTKEANALVHKMLDFSQLNSPDFNMQTESIDMEELSKTVIADYEILPDSKKIILNTQGKCVICADKELMTRAISNLVDNALRYSDNGTIINIDINRNSLIISNVCDDITEDDVIHLTEPYFRAEKNRNSQGSGLGLSIVKSIADMHDYSLDIKLCGSVITFTLTFGK